jgi:hypothetical protein
VKPFSASELAGMRTAQTGHMQDACYIQTYSRTFNSYQEPVESWADAVSPIACGLDMRPGQVILGPEYTTVSYDATIRLPIDTVIDVKDRIKVTSRFGEALASPLVYYLAGPIQRGPSGIRLLLARVDV